jgi:hypothetical protein
VGGREREAEATQEMGGRGCMMRELGVPLTIEGERVRDSILDAVVRVWGESWGRMGVAPVLPPDLEPTRPPVEVWAWACCSSVAALLPLLQLCCSSVAALLQLCCS